MVNNYINIFKKDSENINEFQNIRLQLQMLIVLCTNNMLSTNHAFIEWIVKYTSLNSTQTLINTIYGLYQNIERQCITQVQKTFLYLSENNIFLYKLFILIIFFFCILILFAIYHWYISYNRHKFKFCRIHFNLKKIEIKNKVKY